MSFWGPQLTYHCRWDVIKSRIVNHQRTRQVAITRNRRTNEDRCVGNNGVNYRFCTDGLGVLRQSACCQVEPDLMQRQQIGRKAFTGVNTWQLLIVTPWKVQPKDKTSQ
jgi:hypothetical protein